MVAVAFVRECELGIVGERDERDERDERGRLGEFVGNNHQQRRTGIVLGVDPRVECHRASDKDPQRMEKGAVNQDLETRVHPDDMEFWPLVSFCRG